MEEVGRLKRSASSSSGDPANMEYLKNVVLRCATYLKLLLLITPFIRYMLSSEASSRDHMLKAIGAVLFFSPNEVKQVIYELLKMYLTSL